MRSSPVLALLLLGFTGCSGIFGDRSPDEVGEPLGTFHVSASQTDNSCGEGALGTTPTWEFDVELTRDATSIYWDNGAARIAGSLAADGVTFALVGDVLVDMRTGSEVQAPPCSVARHDTVDGTLAAPDQPEAFSATMGFAFAPQGSCGDLTGGEAPVFANLPCAMHYELSAKRSE